MVGEVVEEVAHWDGTYEGVKVPCSTGVVATAAACSSRGEGAAEGACVSGLEGIRDVDGWDIRRWQTDFDGEILHLLLSSPGL